MSSYLPLSGSKILRKLKRVLEIIKSHNLKFDAIVFTGNSGALVASPLAMALNKKLILIRKGEEILSHGELIEGSISGRYIILDDFIASGKTIDRVTEFLKDTTGKCVGIILYNHPESFNNVKGNVRKEKGHWTHKGVRIYNRSKKDL